MGGGLETREKDPHDHFPSCKKKKKTQRRLDMNYLSGVYSNFRRRRRPTRASSVHVSPLSGVTLLTRVGPPAAAAPMAGAATFILPGPFLGTLARAAARPGPLRLESRLGAREARPEAAPWVARPAPPPQTPPPRSLSVPAAKFLSEATPCFPAPLHHGALSCAKGAP